MKDTLLELNMKAITNVPYTPELNPIELFIRDHKAKVRKAIHEKK